VPSLISPDILKALAPGTSKAKRDRFLPYLNEALPRYDITTPKRISAFLATCCFESDYFRATEEYADGWAYDKSRNPRKAKELGNTEAGDGPKFKGRGLIQLTGRANYAELDNSFEDDTPTFVIYPERLAKPQYAVESACWYWQTRKLNKYADIGAFDQIQGIVNRGNATKTAKDLYKRHYLYTVALAALRTSPILSAPAQPTVAPPRQPEQPSETNSTAPLSVDVPPSSSSRTLSDRLSGAYSTFNSWFDSGNTKITDSVKRKDAAKSTYSLIGGGIWQTILAIGAALAAIPKEIYVVLAIITGVLVAMYLYRQIHLGVIREKRG
jgi:putative chitinase